MDHSCLTEAERTNLAMDLAVKAVYLSQSGLYQALADKFAERAESLLGEAKEDEKK